MNIFDLIFEDKKENTVKEFADAVARKSAQLENEKTNEIKQDSIGDFLDKNPKASYSAIANYVIDRSTPETGKKYLDELNKITKTFTNDNTKDDGDDTKINSFDGIQEILRKKKRKFEKLPEEDKKQIGAPSAFTDNEVVNYANISNKFFVELMYIFYKNCLLQRLSSLRKKTETDEETSELTVKYHQIENEKELTEKKYQEWKKNVGYEDAIADFEETKKYLTPEKREKERKKIEDLKTTARKFLSKISDLNRDSDKVKDQISELENSGDLGFKRNRNPSDYGYILNGLAAGNSADALSTKGRVGYTKLGILEERVKFIRETFDYYKKTVDKIKKLRAEEAVAPLKIDAKKEERAQEDITQEIEEIKKKRKEKLERAEKSAVRTIERINQFLKPTPRYDTKGKALGEMLKIIDDNYDKLIKAYAKRETGDEKEDLDTTQTVFKPLLRTVGRDNEDNFFKSGAKVSGKDLSGLKQDFFMREKNVAKIAAELLNKLFAKGFKTPDYSKPKTAIAIAKEKKEGPSADEIKNREWASAKAGAKSINPDVIKDLNEILDSTQRNINDLVGRIKTLNSEDGLVETLKRLQREEVIRRNFFSPKFQKMDDLRREIKSLEKDIAGGLEKRKSKERKELVNAFKDAGYVIKYIKNEEEQKAKKEFKDLEVNNPKEFKIKVEEKVKEAMKNRPRVKELLKQRQEIKDRARNLDDIYAKLLENITQKLEEKNKEFLNTAHLSNSYGRINFDNAVFMTDFFKFLSGEEAPKKKEEDPTKVKNVPVYSNKADKKLAKSLEELKRRREFDQEYNRNIEAAQRAARDADFRERNIETNKLARPRAVLIKKPKEEKKEE